MKKKERNDRMKLWMENRKNEGRKKEGRIR